MNEYAASALEMINEFGSPILITHKSGKKTKTKAVCRTKTEKVLANGTLTFVTITSFITPATKNTPEPGDWITQGQKKYSITSAVNVTSADGTTAYLDLVVVS